MVKKKSTLNDNQYLRKILEDYISSKHVQIITDGFHYSGYSAPNVNYETSDKFFELLQQLTTPSIKVAARTVILLKRNHDPALAIVVYINYKDYQDIIGRSSFFKAIKELKKHEFILPLPNPDWFIVNMDYINKCFKPKYEII